MSSRRVYKTERPSGYVSSYTNFLLVEQGYGVAVTLDAAMCPILESDDVKKYFEYIKHCMYEDAANLLSSLPPDKEDI